MTHTVLPSQTFRTLRDLLRYAVTRFNTEKLFFGHGSANALDEAAFDLTPVDER